MPKVSEEYFEKKKQFIVDAAYKVCLRKPVEMITMTDVIEETGLSQGGIYRFYKDLDEILCDVIAATRTEFNIIDDIENALGSADRLSFSDGVHKIFDILADAMEKHLLDIQKINFDMTVLAINEPERAKKIAGGIRGRGNFEYLATVALPALIKGSADKGLKPRDDPKKIADFISSAYVGIEMNCILSACYKKAPMAADCRPGPLFDTLARTVVYLCGGEEE